METFAMAHPWMTLWIVLALVQLAWMPFRLVNRMLRSRNVRLRGWPPEHLDADGDFRVKDRT